jgi:P4 family phage/plasmid primase-like protien
VAAGGGGQKGPDVAIPSNPRIAQGPNLDDPPAVWAPAYVRDLDTALTWTTPNTKAPEHADWNTEAQCIRDPDAAAAFWRRNPTYGMGAVHLFSGTATWDDDNPPLTEKALHAIALDAGAWLEAGAEAEGDPTKAKAWYAAPVGVVLEPKKLTWPDPVNPGKHITIFELRGGAVQDLLPRTIHPKTRRPYRWLRSPWELGGWPVMPTDLLDLWLRWEELLPQLEAACPWAAPTAPPRTPRAQTGSSSEWDAVRQALRERVSVEAVLLELGAERRRSRKWLCPFHTEQHPSFWTFEADDGTERWADAHGPAPVGLRSPRGFGVGDVIDLYAYQHDLKPGEATAEMARAYRVPLPSTGPRGDLGYSYQPTVPNGNGHTAEDSDPLHLTDIGNAKRFVKAHGARLRYCYRFGCWYVWTGKRWEEDERGCVERLGKQTILSWYADAAKIQDDQQRATVVAHARRCEAAGRIEAMLRLARSEDGIAVLPDEFDCNPWLLNCLNGTVDLRTGELRPHDPADLITKLVPIAYDAAATCPTWETFLAEVLPEPAVRSYAQRAAGYAATGDTSEQVIFFPFGSGANGKSTYLSMQMAALGDYAKQAAPDLLTYSRNERHPTELADLVGVRFVAAIEVDEGKRLAEALVKQMTGGDRMKARRMRENFFDFTPTHKVFLAANHRPVIRGTDHAIWRRIHLIPFSVTIPLERQDKQLPAKLYQELPGILRWIVDGCLAWQRDGLGLPDAVEKATKEYREEQDVLATFITERCVEHPTAEVETHALYVAYSEWCKASGEEPLTKRWLGPRLRERGYTPTHSMKTRGWKGIGLAAVLGDLP